MIARIFLLVLASATAVQAAEPKPLFDSKLVTTRTKGHAVKIDVPLGGAKRLYLVVTDGGNGYGCDWADWAEPRFVTKAGVKKLTDLKWKSASAGWGRVRVNRNAGGGTLKIAGEPVSYGIGTHANSVIVYDVPKGATRFQATAGLDNGGTDQQNGGATSVRFLVFTEKPPASILAASRQASTEPIGRDPKDAVKSLDIPKDLRATLFASEPMLKSPSNIDIDHRGRIWVCEIVNYRHFRNKSNPPRKEGDRILILEDTTGDGKADKSTVFYQGRDIDSAHGILVLGTPTGKNTKVLVSANASVFVFTDTNGDGKSDKKEVLFTGIGGTQHDHGIHAFVFGPDGRLYFNFGNSGKTIKDKNGKPIVDKAGNVVNDSRQPYQEGMIFRCKLDGSDLETLAWNFRNNWEVCVDSFGSLWQSDNDDDGNRGVRINFVMEYGNYGYKDELTGAGWRSPRTGMHAEIPKRHWHLNDPGVVPNLLQTYAGSPTGICVYEGTLLPKRFRNQILHCDAGPNVVRSYPVKKDGAGYSASINPILTGKDKWFRPSDVCVAPDGSIFVADWFDPTVGGHRQGDINAGRIFRVAPPNSAYKVPQHDFTTMTGLLKALNSPNLATRSVAWRAIHARGAAAEQPLKKVFATSKNPRERARVLWLLGNIEVCGQHYVEQAVTDKDPNIRITAIRVARQIGSNLPKLLKDLVHDKSPQVRRECAIALREVKDKDAVELWVKLATQHDGKDRWYLEALGIAAERRLSLRERTSFRGAKGDDQDRWDRFTKAWLEQVGDKWNTPAGRDILWRSRSSLAMPYLAKIVLSARTQPGGFERYFRAFDFHQPKDAAGIALKKETLLKIATANHKNQAELTSLAIKHLGSVDLSKSPKLKAAVNKAIDKAKGTEAYVRMVSQLNLSERYPDLLAIAQKQPDEQLGVEAIRALLEKKQWQLISKGLNAKDEKQAVATANALGNSADGRIAGLLRPYIVDRKRPIAVRKAAALALGKTRNGARQLLRMAQMKRVDKALEPAVASALHSVTARDIKAAALKLYPLPATKNNKPLPPISELLKRRGNVALGRIVFNSTGTCVKCHQVNGFGKQVGPDLSEIGKKLSRKAMYDSIIFPSAGISHNYETYVIATTSGNQATGLLVSKTKEAITLKGADAIARTFKMSDVEFMKKQTVSLMPADLAKTMTAKELVNVVEYMLTLKKAKKPTTKPATGGR